jgi:magnesium transporter
MNEGKPSYPWQHLENLLERGDSSELRRYLRTLAAADRGRVFSRLSVGAQRRLLGQLEVSEAAELAESLPAVQLAEAFEHLSVGTAAPILEQMPSDERADLLGALSESAAEAIIGSMRPAAARETRRLIRYAPDVAGGLMITEYLSYPQNTTVGELVEDFQAHSEAYSDYDVQYTYVVGSGGILAGVLRLRELLLAARNTPIDQIMIPDPLHVKDMDSLEQLGGFFDQHQFVGAPVVDSAKKLVGVVRRHDVEEALADRSESHYLKSQGIVGEELRTMPLWRRSSRRLSWLSINIVLNIVAASVIAVYQDTLAAIIALAVFLPIISDMSGCSGNQAVAVSMRELSLGLVKPYEAMRVWAKEIGVGLINGLILGLLLGTAAWLWKGNLVLGLVVASAMALNTVVAVSIGGTVPLALKRLKMDPALASGPILTTITDMCGFFLVLSFATMMLAYLQ